MKPNKKTKLAAMFAFLAGLSMTASATPIDVSDIVTDAQAQLTSTITAVLPWVGALAIAAITVKLIRRFVK